MKQDKISTNEATPQFIKRGEFAITLEYRQWLTDLKQRLQQRQIKAAIKVNRALLEFYWQLGHDIALMHPEEQWGSGFFEQLSLDLRDSFPELKGLSVTNLKYTLHFQGTKTTASSKMQMNTKSDDAHYTELISDLRTKLRILADKIAEKVYEYGFLK